MSCQQLDIFKGIDNSLATLDLTSYDLIVVSTSAGKDSQAMLWTVYLEAKRLGITDRLRAVHADLGKCEWTGVAALARHQCDLLNIPLTIVSRPQGDLLELQAYTVTDQYSDRYALMGGSEIKVTTETIK